MKTVYERKGGKHLRGCGRAGHERLVAALDLRLFQGARVTRTRGQAEHEEDDGQQVEFVHSCESLVGECEERKGYFF
jgi:hypothetical protein